MPNPNAHVISNAEMDERIAALGQRERAAGRIRDNTVTVTTDYRYKNGKGPPGGYPDLSAAPVRNGGVPEAGEEVGVVLCALDARIAELQHELERLQTARDVVAELPA
jgi:uncharacterized small protein (DUF1192 family)